MGHLQRWAMISVLLAACSPAHAQNLQAVDHLWQQTVAAVQHGQTEQARTLFGQFNQAARAYVSDYGNNWQIEYMVGSLDCQFPDGKADGARILKDVLEDERTLNSDGEAELRRQIAACSLASASSDVTWSNLPHDVTDAFAHYETPGVHGNMKGGFHIEATHESTEPVSPIPQAQLLARRVSINQPQEALTAALRRLPAGATGGVAHGFAVVIGTPNRSRALGIGACLSTYVAPLQNEFQIEPSNYVITVYTADSTDQVDHYARTLHGLDLPDGVVAYSVPEDMSLTAVAEPDSCGSMAHELVHLLIKRSLPVSPAWLEEGLASEVAVAIPTPAAFKFGYSWRDDILKDYSGAHPTVSDLIDMPWSSFSVSDSREIEPVAAIQAMAAVFIRYLDAKGKLADTYFAVRDRHLSPDLSGFKSYREILESELGMSIAGIDHDFQQWFSQQKPMISAEDKEHSQQPNAQYNSPANAAAPCQTDSPPQEANAPPNLNGSRRPCPTENMNSNGKPSPPKK